MGNINYSRVLLGGIVAGALFMAIGFAGFVITGTDVEAWLARHSLHEPPAWAFIFVDLVLGLLAVWLYAAIRPRYGPGAPTAATAAIFIWMLLAFAYFGFHMMALFTPIEYVTRAAIGLVQCLVGTLAGAWLYREEGEAARV